MSLKRLFTLFISGFPLITQVIYPLDVLGGNGSSKKNMKQDQHAPNVRELSTADPEQDFAAAKSRGDIHFLAMRGFTIDVPGVEANEEYLIRRVGKRVIVGSSDVVG